MKRLTAPLLLLFLMIACQESDLQKVFKGLVAAQEVIGSVQTAAIAAHQNQLITTEETKFTVQICVQLSDVVHNAALITSGIAANPGKAQLLAILPPVIKAAADAATKCTFIKNLDTQKKIQALLLGIETTLNAVQLAVSGGK